MKKLLIILVILFVILLVVLLSIGGWMKTTYNTMVTLDENANTAWAQVENVLQRRFDLIPNLVETVKGYATHESDVLTQVTEARASVGSAGTPAQRMKAEGELSGALSRLLVVVENYPNLKANENFAELQRELAATEDKVAYARQFYNDSILDYNNLCTTFPGKVFAGMFGRKQREYIKIAPSEREVVKVKF